MYKNKQVKNFVLKRACVFKQTYKLFSLYINMIFMIITKKEQIL